MSKYSCICFIAFYLLAFFKHTHTHTFGEWMLLWIGAPVLFLLLLLLARGSFADVAGGDVGEWMLLRGKKVESKSRDVMMRMKPATM